MYAGILLIFSYCVMQKIQVTTQVQMSGMLSDLFNITQKMASKSLCHKILALV